MIRYIAALAFTFLASGQPAFAGDLPGPDTPGALNPNVTQYNLASTVCSKPKIVNGKPIGWTATVRPSASFTNKLKEQQMLALGLPGKPSDYEEDHRVPLECGGNPTDPRNLSPELWVADYGAHTKDAEEDLSHRRLCKGLITLAQCQAIFLAPHDWRDDFDETHGPKGVRSN